MTGNADAPMANWDIVVVTFNSARPLREVWAGVPIEIRERVICVDNSSTDATREVAAELFPTVVTLPNLGLSIANNFGARHGSAPFVLFANPDLAPRAEDFDRLERHLQEHGGLVSPRLVGDNGEEQDNARDWPALKSQVMNRLSGPRSQSYRWPVPPGQDSPVPWVLGAAIAVTREDFERIGGWPEEYFLYYEDVVLCLKAWQQGLAVWVLGSMRWHHQWAKSSRSLFSRSTRMHAASAARFFSRTPRFLFGPPSTIRRRYLSERARVSAGFSPAVVDLVVRSDSRQKGGGDLVQAERYVAEFEALGVDARVVPFTPDYNPSPTTLVHLFNVDRPYEYLLLAKKLGAGRYVTSPIHHSGTLTRRMRRAEAPGFGIEGLVARLPESLREALLFVRRTALDGGESALFTRLRVSLKAIAAVPFMQKRMRTALGASRTVFLLSRREADDLRRDFGFESDNTVLVPNGLERSGEGFSWQERKPRILVVGRIEPRKRQVEVLAAANKLNVALTFVGPANANRDGYVSRFEKLLSEGPSEWLGARPHDEVLDLMGASRVLLNLSWVEVQSLVDLEAAGMGCYVVISAAGSTKEWLGDSSREFPVEDLEAPLLAAAELAQTDEAPPTLTYTQTWRRAAEQLVALYESGNRCGKESDRIERACDSSSAAAYGRQQETTQVNRAEEKQ